MGTLCREPDAAIDSTTIREYDFPVHLSVVTKLQKNDRRFTVSIYVQSS